MGSIIGPMVLGLFIFILGIFNMKGNISSIHWYHRQRVSEEDKISFGRMVGLGTIIIGICVFAFGGFAFAAEKLHNDLYILIGAIVMIVGFIAGLILSFYAMIKYNKGIF